MSDTLYLYAVDFFTTCSVTYSNTGGVNQRLSPLSNPEGPSRREPIWNMEYNVEPFELQVAKMTFEKIDSGKRYRFLLVWGFKEEVGIVGVRKLNQM